MLGVLDVGGREGGFVEMFVEGGVFVYLFFVCFRLGVGGSVVEFGVWFEKVDSDLECREVFWIWFVWL